MEAIFRISDGNVSEWVIHWSKEEALAWWREWKIYECGWDADEIASFEVVERLSRDAVFTLAINGSPTTNTHTVAEWCEIALGSWREAWFRGEGWRFVGSTEY